MRKTDREFREHYGNYALVLGAAQGLGEAYARVLAAQGIHLLLVDIQEERLQQTALTLAREYGVSIQFKALDLADQGAISQLMEFVCQEPDCRLFIYCAAYAPVRSFLANEPGDLDRFIDTNTRTLLHLCHSFARRLEGRSGGMILISSLSGRWGTALLAPYGATKAFIWNLGEALFHELRPQRINVLTVAPGPTATPAYLASQPAGRRGIPRAADPLAVARSSFRRLGRQPLFLPGLGNHLAYLLLHHLLPERLASWLVNREVQRRYGG